jgi:tetratricopeptide (TPR) repeat protein
MRSNPSRRHGPLIGTGSALLIALAIVGVGAAGIYTFVYRPAADVAAKGNTGNENSDSAGNADNHDSSDKNAGKHKDVKHLRDSAHKLMKAKKYKEAMHDFAEILKQYPEDAEAAAGKQKALEEIARASEKPMADKQKELDAEAAEKKAKENEEKRKTELASLIKQGNDALAMNQLVQAEDFFKKALETAPGNEDAAKGLNAVREGLAQAELDRRYKSLLDAARTSLQAGRYPDAMRDASAAQQVMPANATAVAAAFEIYRQAETQLTMLKDQDERKQAYMKVMELGTAALREKRFPEAMVSFNSALKVVPDDPAATKGLADAKLGMDQYNVQVALLRAQYQAQIMQGMRAEAYRVSMELGRNAMFNKQYADAMMAYRNALLNVPNDPFALQGYNYAQQLLAGTLQTKQVADFKLAQAAEFLKKQQYVPARDLYIDAEKIMPDHPDVRAIQILIKFTDAMARGQTAIAARRFGEATNAILQALSFSMEDLFAQQALQQALDQGGKMYADSMDKGKKALDAKNYPEAVARYSDALASLADATADVLYPQLPVSRAAAKMGLDQAQQLGLARYNDDMARAQQAMNAKNYAEAINQYTDALSILPNDQPAKQGLDSAQSLLQTAGDFDKRLRQANQFLKQQRYTDARDAFNDLVKLAASPTQAQAMKDQAGYADAMGRGQSAMTLKTYPDAVLAYTDALRILPKDVPATQGLQAATKLAAGGDQAKSFDAAVKNADQLFNLQKYAEASKAYSDAIKLQPSDPSVAILQIKVRFSDAMVRGQSAMNMKNYPNALAAFNEALTQLPDNPQAVQARNAVQTLLADAGAAKDFAAKVGLADKLLAAQKYADAGKAYNDVSATIPGDSRVTNLQTKANFASAMVQAQAAAKGNQWNDAVTAYNQALTLMKNDPVATQGLVDAQQRLKAAQAMQDVNKKLALAKQDFDNKVKAGDQALAQQKYTDAGKFYHDALKAMNDMSVQQKASYADAMARGKSAMSTNNYAGAINAFMDAMSKASAGDTSAQLALQDAQQKSQQAGAAAAAQTRKEFDSKVAQANSFLAMAPPRYADVSRLLSEAVNLIPNDPNAKEMSKKAHYADAMAKGHTAMMQKNHKEAVRQFQIAVNEYPNDPPAMTALNNAKKAK